jgi:hypothetical protein
MGRDGDPLMVGAPRTWGRATVLPMLLGVVVTLTLLSSLRPVVAHPAVIQTTITPTCYVYLPYVVRGEAVPTPTVTPMPGIDLIAWDIVNYPVAPVIGQTVIITISVRNQGADNAPVGTFVTLRVDGELVPPEVFIPPMQSGETRHIPWGKSTSSLGVGWHSVRGDVDPDGFVSESNEDNNFIFEQQSFEVLSSSQ